LAVTSKGTKTQTFSNHVMTLVGNLVRIVS